MNLLLSWSDSASKIVQSIPASLKTGSSATAACPINTRHNTIQTSAQFGRKVFIRAPRVTAPAMEPLQRSAKFNMSPAHNGFVLGDRFFRTIPNMHPRVHVRRAAEIPQHRRPFDLPHIPHAILADVHSFV